MHDGLEINIKLDDYVKEREAQAGGSLQYKSRFGLDREGSYINSWQMNYQRIGFFGNSFVVRNYDSDAFVQIEVPTTETGIAPTMNDQLFGWTGKINEYSAELAVWWAFELLTDAESREFMRVNKPAVIFRFFEQGRSQELETKFNGHCWIALYIR